MAVIVLSWVYMFLICTLIGIGTLSPGRNRRFSVIPKYPANLPGQWIATPLRRPEKLYGQLCCLAYLEQSIQPNNSLKRNILELMSGHPEIDLNAMGFQQDWQEQPLWKRES